MTNLTLIIEKTIDDNAQSVDNLLKYLFCDKKAVYVDDINFNLDGGYDVSWCLEYTLHLKNPQWMDTYLGRATLIAFISAENLNEWETFRYNHQTGSVQPQTNIITDLETFLNENYEEVIKEYLTVNF